MSQLSYLECLFRVCSCPREWFLSVLPTLIEICDEFSDCFCSTLVSQLRRCSYRLKNTRTLDNQSSYKTWNELISNGWELVEHKFNGWVEDAQYIRDFNILLDLVIFYYLFLLKFWEFLNSWAPESEDFLKTVRPFFAFSWMRKQWYHMFLTIRPW